jgi:hypothetical protein
MMGKPALADCSVLTSGWGHAQCHENLVTKILLRNSVTPFAGEIRSMPFRTKPAVSRIILSLILGSGFVFCLAINWPGHLSYDSLMQLLEGRQGRYGNWHPAVMSWMLGIADWAHPGAGLFTLFDQLLLFGTLSALLAFARGRFLAAGLVAVALIALPQTVLYQAIVWKDVLFADAAVAGFAALALAARFWPRRGLRIGLIGMAVLFLVLAALARQNGILMLLAGGVTLGLVASRLTPGFGLRYGLLALSGGVAALVLAGFALSLRSVPGGGTGQEIAQLQSFDLAGALAADPNLPLAVWDKKAPGLARVMRRQAPIYYSPARNDTLARAADLQDALDNAAPHLITAQWLDLIRHHTGLYLKVRADVFWWTFFTPRIAACVPFVVGVEGRPSDLKALNMVRRFDGRDRALDNYATAFTGTPVFSHAAFALVGVMLFGILLWRRRAADLAMAGLIAGAFLFTLSFFVLSLACDYRYLYVLDLAVMVCGFYLALDGRLSDTGRDKQS